VIAPVIALVATPHTIINPPYTLHPAASSMRW